MNAYSHFTATQFATQYGKVCKILLKISVYGFQVMFLGLLFVQKYLEKTHCVNE